MDLILWRHAEAEDWQPDDAHRGSDLDRALTARGEKQAARMAAWMWSAMAASQASCGTTVSPSSGISLVLPGPARTISTGAVLAMISTEPSAERSFLRSSVIRLPE